ncbi:hypothetical protein CVT26_008768 [Gymnopilus dilepis]|uniref:Uncharacterized protein n=1 Tax=Gymnopilus dilepis TaxID=231916 RepID=A0A409WUF4_9AGAR|nr:hypothetical protein CVT26_008768 [Gymnopilus dilepis]
MTFNLIHLSPVAIIMSSESVTLLEKELINYELNSTIFSVFLWGICTVIYAGTLFLYLTKRSSRNKLIVGAISLSYCAYSTTVAIFWYRDQSALVNHSETRDAIFEALYLGSDWTTLVTDLMVFILAGVADSILYPATDFRCLIQLVIDLVILGIWAGAYHLGHSFSQNVVLNRLLAVQAFVTFATTFSSTTLIAHRIHTTMRDIPRTSKRLLGHILEILVQSAAAYSLVAIAQSTASNQAAWIAADDYISSLFFFTSAVSPTVLVARVAMLDENDVYASSSATNSRPSLSLQFRVQHTQDDTVLQSHLPANSDREQPERLNEKGG